MKFVRSLEIDGRDEKRCCLPGVVVVAVVVAGGDEELAKDEAKNASSQCNCVASGIFNDCRVLMYGCEDDVGEANMSSD